MLQGFYLGHLGRVPVYAGGDLFLLPLFIWFIVDAHSIQVFIAALIGLISAILLHELGHAATARATGMRGVSILIGGLGGLCAYTGDRRPGKEISISLSGPAANLLLVAALYVLPTERVQGPLALVLLHLFWWNLVLGIFNLIPIYPLDGGQALRSAGMLVARPATVNRLVLGVSVAAAIGTVALFTALTGGQPPLWTIFIVGFLLFTAFRELR